MFSLVLLAVVPVAAVIVIAYNLALYAMPVMAGAAAFDAAHSGGAGVLLSGLAAAAAGIAAVLAVLCPLVRLGGATLFAGPAVIAGYAVAAPIAVVAISIVGGLVIGVAALTNLMALANPEP